jgi:putative thioredoxin
MPVYRKVKKNIMDALKHVVDGTRDNFRQLVLENSHKGTVLVHYWAPDAGPCFRLWQVLERLSQEYQGRFLLVNVNTRTQIPLLRENGITSVPTLKIYHRGKIVESIYGAQSEAAIRKLIDRYVQPAHDSVITQAIRSYQSGHVDDALQLLIEAVTREPENVQLHATALKLLLREKRYPDIESYVSVLPDNIKSQADIGTLQVHAKILHLAQQAPSAAELDHQLETTPDDLNAVLSRAAVAMVEDDYETALKHLMHVFRQDRHYNDELSRKAMLVVFSLLGDQHELTRTFQASMREVLH